jgi:BlaR1 peptidase M56
MSADLLHLLAAISTGAADALVSAIWQGAVLAAGVALCLRLFPRVSATSRFAIWTAAFLTLALLPFVRLPHSVPAGQLTSPGGPMFHVDVRWSFLIAAVWAVLSLLRAIRLAMNALRLRRLWRSAAPVDFRRAGVAGLSNSPGTVRQAEIFTSTEIDRPSVIGFFSPRILIPSWLIDKFSPAELEQIILHEREHLRRADDWINLGQKIALALFPLNPVLLWIEKRLCFERELACDDGVIRATRAPRAYASCLTSLAERRLDRRATSLSLGVWERRPALARRVLRILLNGNTLEPRYGRGVTAALVCGLLLGALGLSHCPQFVSFSASPQAAEASAQPRAAVGISGNATVQDVSFHEPDRQKATLVKASLVSYRGAKTGGQPKHRRAVHPSGSSLRPASNSSHEVPSVPVGGWMVVTSWEESYSPTVVLTVMTYSSASSTRTSLPADAGWIFFQL